MHLRQAMNETFPVGKNFQAEISLTLFTFVPLTIDATQSPSQPFNFGSHATTKITAAKETNVCNTTNVCRWEARNEQKEQQNISWTTVKIFLE